ncbi:MAG: hypothetical protein AAFR82_09065 [Pseudomonadota bacterium]
MASVYVSIKNDTVLGRFQQALNEASCVASDMIEVKTKIEGGSVLKVIRTECPWAIAVFRSLSSNEGGHD